MKNKKYLSFLLILTMLFSTLSGISSPLTAFAEDGAEPSLNENGYYEISNADELYWFAEKVNGGEGTINAILTADITINENVIVDGKLAEDTSSFKAWTPIGTKSNKYSGKFDGQGHTVSGLYIVNETADYVGFFGIINNNAEITGLNVANSYLRSDYYDVGGIVGFKLEGKISDCKSLNNIISGIYYVGGIVGLTNNGDVVNCYNSSAVSVDVDGAGGIVGQNYGNTYIKNCYNEGEISGYLYIGGICGINEGEISGSYNKGFVSAKKNYAGGIVGSNKNGTVNSTYSVGKVTATNNAGGVVGWNLSKIYNSYYDKTVSDIEAVGEIDKDRDTINEAYGKESESFKSGEVAYLLYLNEEGSAFGQDLEKGEELPTFSEKKVYKDCAGNIYTNDYDISKHNYNEKGICVRCGSYQEPEFKDYSYQIGNVGNLYWFAEKVNSGESTINATLTADIAINENVIVDGKLAENTSSFKAWVPIGTEDNGYGGKFDGQGHTISGLYINVTDDYVGFFGRIINDAEITGLNVADSYIKGGDNYIGGIVGYKREGQISDCKSLNNIISGFNSVGGIVGFNNNEDVVNCYNSSAVSGENYNVGGIVALSNGIISSKIKNCINIGDINGYIEVGGIVGNSTDNTIYIENCYNTGKITGSNCIGGIVGSSMGKISGSYNTGSVSATEYYAGGIAGDNSGTINSTYSVGKVTANESAGGVVGYNKLYIYNSYYDKTVSDIEAVGKNESSSTIIEAYGKESGSFKSGEIAYLLSLNDAGSAFGQDLEKGEELPSFSEKRVYKACSGDVYTNNIDEVKHSYNEKGICENCGDFQEPKLENNSYQISNAGNLYWFAKRVNNGANTINAVLTDDIVINENVIVNGELNTDTTSFLEWTPIGNRYNKFSGRFDGQGHFISGLYVASDEYYIGLIGFISDNCDVCNVSIRESYIKGGNYVGGIVGCIYALDCALKNCNSEGIIIGNSNVGGIAGYSYTNIIECSNSASVSGNEEVGGIAGYSRNITDCYNLGDIKGTSWVGGVVGGITGTVKQIYNSGKVSGSEYVGGLIGNLINSSSVNNGYFNSDEFIGEAVGSYNADKSTVGDDVLGKASESFKNGEVTYLLNKDNSSAFGQDLAIDLFPVLNGPKVYMKENKNCDGSSKYPIAYLFSNDESLENIIDKHNIKDWACQDCNTIIGELTADTDASGYADEDIIISGSAISYGVVEGDITYQWYKEGENGLEKIEGATENTYAVPKEVGTNKYYLSAKIGEYEKITEATVVNVIAVPFKIGGEIIEKIDKVVISFELLKNDDIAPSYQWYEEINGEFVKIENANEKRYEIPEGKAKGNYKCLVSFGEYSRFSDVIAMGSEKYTVTVKSNNADLGSAVASKSSVFAGEEVSLKAKPLADYASFLGWYDESGKLVSEELEYSFKVNENVSLTAVFRDNRRKVGDINNDGVVDMTDVNETLKKALNDDYVSGDTNVDFSYADVDNDGKITATDASLIRSMIR